MNIKLKKILLFIGCCIFIFCYTYFYSTLFNDEIWNYGFGYNIASGLIPYKDFNMIITPFYSFIVSFFIKLFGHHLWSIHIFNSIMISSILFIGYYDMGKKVLLLLAIILLYCYPGYNLFCLFLMIIIITICDKEFKRKDIIMGILGGILFLSKQTVGICVWLPILYYSKNNIKSLIGYGIPIILLLLYLIYYDAFYQFIDYCFLGMFDFSSSNNISLFLPIEIIICIILLYHFIKSGGKNKKLFFILMFQIITIPICDDYHFMIGFLSVFYYILKYVNIKDYKIKYYFIILLFFTMDWNYISNDYGNFYLYSDKNSYLYGRYMDEYIEESITNISDYMENIKEEYDNIYLFTQNSYQIKMNTSYMINKFDLINDGNMGYKGNIRYIEELKSNCSRTSCLFIIYKYEIDDSNLNANQTNVDIIYFVNDNFNKIGEVDQFEIYNNKM